ncbi:hypothetical protein JOF29_006113 [Kribbella aluminosa]|uniref:Twin-arginine translocation signal domain-containing protein n=1 Tax=Kribbella aluminosa TaxID=416017 RepID=A0ABS4UTN4_9ACTN|nr:hypothetical protein [Kribbella aluminosa]MBP2355003.1 hypothetical protein [Kribbella aluminosa]
MDRIITSGVNRRTFLVGSIGTAAALGLSSRPGVASAAPTFKVYNAVRARPDLSAYGVPKRTMIYQNALVVNGTGDETLVKNTIQTNMTAGVTQACLDIEAWPLDSLPDADFAVNAAKYNEVAGWVKEVSPSFRLGWYGILPRRDYWSVIQGTTAAWYADNARRQVIADHVDDVYPSLYTFYTDQTGWVNYANANLTQAGIYNRPGYAIIWPKYHPSAPADIRGTFIARDYWRLQLETVLAHQQSAGSAIVGVAIWNDDSTWDPTADWWLETIDFVNDHNLG